MTQNGDGTLLAEVVIAKRTAEARIAGGAGVAVGEEGDTVRWARSMSVERKIHL